MRKLRQIPIPLFLTSLLSQLETQKAKTIRSISILWPNSDLSYYLTVTYQINNDLIYVLYPLKCGMRGDSNFNCQLSRQALITLNPNILM